MSTKVAVLLVAVMTFANAAMLAINLSTPLKAAVAGMDAYDLKADYDFKRAVESIVEDCTVDESSISC